MYESFPEVPPNYKWKKDTNSYEVVLLKKGVFGRWREIERVRIRYTGSPDFQDYHLTASVMWRFRVKVHGI